MTDRNDLAAAMAHRARDAAYVAVGLGVLGFQRAQVQRRQVRRLAGEVDLGHRAAELRAALATGVQQFDELMEGAVQMVESSLQPLEEQLPPMAREVAQRVVGQAREVSSQIRQLVTPAS